MKLIFTLLVFLTLPLHAQPEFNKQEFQSRRDKLFEKIPGGMAIVLSSVTSAADEHPRQSPDFFYLTGLEEPNAVLVMLEWNRRTYVFSKKRDDNEIKWDGPGVWQHGDARELYGLQLIELKYFWSFIGSWAAKAKTLHLSLTPMDNRNKGRDEAAFLEAIAMEHPLYGKESDVRTTVRRLRDWLPQLPVADINPLIDELRWVKTPYEIERLRKSGKIGAEGIKQAIRGTKPGMYEYELVAAARYVYNKNGAFDAFKPIAASGPNSVIVHYRQNNRQMKAGEIVLLDYGADYAYYTSDITRTWPVSGKVDAEQEKMYKCILDARNSILAAMRPGITINQMKAIGDSVYRKHGYEKEYRAWGRYVGHYIGISVHDVEPFDHDHPFEAGVVFNLEPVIENREKQIHLRLEDTILITPTGHENLTADVPAEIPAIYSLIKEKGMY